MISCSAISGKVSMTRPPLIAVNNDIVVIWNSCPAGRRILYVPLTSVAVVKSKSPEVKFTANPEAGSEFNSFNVSSWLFQISYSVVLFIALIVPLTQLSLAYVNSNASSSRVTSYELNKMYSSPVSSEIV